MSNITGSEQTELSRSPQPRSRHPDGFPREQGDGAPVASSYESLPSSTSGTRGHGSDSVASSVGQLGNNSGTAASGTHKPFSARIEIDFMQLLLTVIAFLTRTWRLGYPRAVVFDELHFAKYVSLYIKRTFFFDVHPPLGKMMLAAAGKYANFEGDTSFEQIGNEFSKGVPVEALRAVPAVLGSLTVPVMYQICVETGMSRYAALVGGLLILLDNALLVQSRYMLMESMLIFFSLMSVLAYLKCRNSPREFSVRWWFWLCVCGVFSCCTMSIKYVGVFTLLLVALHVFKDFWNMLDDDSKSDFFLLRQFFARVFALLLVPVGVYLCIFYTHLSILNKAGPHDTVMTSAFQASLEGGLATLTKGQPLHIAYGSQVTLRHTENVGSGQPCWLHSHPYMYPVRYPDGRGSSHQQQVTCYVFKDINNWFIIKHPDRDSLFVETPPTLVKHGDIVQLVHGVSSRALNTHDVAAPVTPSNQEVSCYVNYNVSMPAQNLWRVEIVNRESDDETWQTIQSEVRFVHVNTSTAVRTTGKQLPEWGFHQLEVAADRHVDQKNTLWNVEEHRFTKASGKDGQTVEFKEEEMIPLKPTYLSFWAKFTELQHKMLMSKQDSDLEHKYSSKPKDWPFMGKNIAYWMDRDTNAQIHLIGNIVIWFASSISVLAYLAVGVFHLLRRQRCVHDISEATWDRYVFMGELFVGGYLIHYVPFYMEDRTLFMHHYLPAVPYKMLTLVALGDHLLSLLPRKSMFRPIIQYAGVALMAVVFHVFLSLSVFTYGHEALSGDQLDKMVWIDAWEYLKHS